LSVLIAGWLPVVVGFVLPALYLLEAAFERIQFVGVRGNLVSETVNTVIVSLGATALTVACAVVVVYAVRLSRSRVPVAIAGLSSIGYAVPGTVLAIGLLPVVTEFDALLDRMSEATVGVSTGLLILGSGTALVYAYLVRFLAVAQGGVSAGFARVSHSLDDAARTLGERALGRLRRVHVPLTRPALLTAAMLVFVDCMKELPATLLLRPIGFETLATHLYGEAARGTYEDAAVAALLIVAVGLVPVLILARLGRVRELAEEQPDLWLSR
jgi:iron(III) transport system permease protein